MAEMWRRIDTGQRDWQAIESHMPELLKDDVDQFGVQRVWNVGLSVLGYPVTWCHTNPEAMRVHEALESQG